MSTKGIIARAIAGGVAGYSKSRADSVNKNMDLIASEIVSNANMARQINMARFTTQLEGEEWDRRSQKENTEWGRRFDIQEEAASATAATERANEIIGYQDQRPVTRAMYAAKPEAYGNMMKDLPTETKDNFVITKLEGGGYAILNKATGEVTDDRGANLGTLSEKELKDIEIQVNKQFDQTKDFLTQEANGPLSPNQVKMIKKNYRDQFIQEAIQRKLQRYGGRGVMNMGAGTGTPAPAAAPTGQATTPLPPEAQGLVGGKLPRTGQVDETGVLKGRKKAADFFVEGPPFPEKVAARVSTAAANAKKNLTNPDATEIGQGNILDDIGIIGKAANDPTVKKQVADDIATVRRYLRIGPMNMESLKGGAKATIEAVQKAAEAIKNQPEVQRAVENLKKNLGVSEKDVIRVVIQAGPAEAKSGL